MLAKHRKIIIPTTVVGAVLPIAPTPARAVFGFGDLVFDATSYAQLLLQGTQLGQQIQQLAMQIEIWQTAFMNLKNRYFWKTTSIQIANTVIRNRFGETANINTGSPGSWQTATLPIGNVDYLAAQKLGDSVQLSNLASVEMTDGYSQDALTAIASHRDNQPAQESSITDLENRALSDDPDDNTLTAQQNITNGALLAQLRAEQTQESINAAVLQQLTVANTFQRNAASDSLNTFGRQQQALADGTAQFSGVSDTLSSFDIP